MNRLKNINWGRVWLYIKLSMAILLGPIAALSYFINDDAVLLFILAFMGWMDYVIEKAEAFEDE